jgi:hypothetical protein
MSKIIICDLEANDLTPDRIHCICMQELGTDNMYEITDNFRENYLKAIKPGYTYVWHNGIGYDFPVLESLHGISYSIQPDCINEIPVQIIDTLVLSRELNPDRIGGHSLKAWEERVTGKKVPVQDWEDQPIEVYLDRCRGDVILTGNVLEALLKEAEIEI